MADSEGEYFQLGDVVQFKRQGELIGPLMTITCIDVIDPNRIVIDVVWFDKNDTLQRTSFRPDQLCRSTLNK